jgi:hypothetical protein
MALPTERGLSRLVALEVHLRGRREHLGNLAVGDYLAARNLANQIPHLCVESLLVERG